MSSTLRGHPLAGRLDAPRAVAALADLAQLPLTRVPSRRLLERFLELRANLTVHDASFVPCAEALGAVLVTADARMAAAPGPRCRIEVLG